MNTLNEQVKIHTEILTLQLINRKIQITFFDETVINLEVETVSLEHPGGKPSFCSVKGTNLEDETEITVELENVKKVETFKS